MKKLTIHHVAEHLVAKLGIQKREALDFIIAAFDIVREELDKGGTVKIKGLGTFKIIGVEARESVNVNTGERVYIESHGKLSFTPDASMKELVNKPFSGFETVILNEGVNFADTPESNGEEEPEASEEQEVPEPQEVLEAPEVLEEPEAPEDSEAPEDPEVLEDLEVPEAPVEAPVEAPLIEAPEEQEEEQTTTKNTEPKKTILPMEDEKRSKSWIVWCALCVLCFAGGYYLGEQKDDNREVKIAEVIQGMELEAATADSVDQEKADSSVTEKKPEVAEVKEVKEVAKATEQPASKPVSQPTSQPASKPASQSAANMGTADYLKYEAKDARVRTGAYYIMGTAEVVKAREGETLEHLSRRILGDGMVCYLAVYNNLEDKAQLKGGQDIKIPKLELKKKIKKQNQK
ncbi:MAG: HU family DNA-binding protein [Prevotella sp.]|nr:HU family DNA-binding protein [Prevotella sp.]